MVAGETMGTRWSLRFAASSVSEDAAAETVQRACDLVVAQMSPWDGESALSRYNRAPAGSWQVLPPALLHVLTTAIDVAQASGDAFDPAMGAITDIWGFGARPAASLPPSAAAIDEARARSGYHRILLDRFAQRAFQPGVALDLNGIAKGYAVDVAAEGLRGTGVRDFLIEIGGELRGEGVKPDGSPWWVEIEQPPGAAGQAARVALHGLSIATSGDYRRVFEHDGRRYAHSLDPRTGRPVANEIASVTVLHAQCMLADAYATAITVLGAAEGLAFAEREALAAIVTERRPEDYHERLSPVMEAMLL